MTVRDALVEAMAGVITPQDETSISPSLPVAYLFVLSDSKKKYGNEETLQLSIGDRTKEKVDELYDGLYAAIGTTYTSTDGTYLAQVVWEPAQALVMLDGSWGRRMTLKISYWGV